MVSPTVDNQMLLTNFLKKKQSWIAKYPCLKESSRYQQVELLLPLRQWMNLRLKMHYNNFFFFAMEATINIRAGMCIHLLDLEKAGWGIALLSSCKTLLHNFFIVLVGVFIAIRKTSGVICTELSICLSARTHSSVAKASSLHLQKTIVSMVFNLFLNGEERTVTTTNSAQIVHLLTSP